MLNKNIQKDLIVGGFKLFLHDSACVFLNFSKKDISAVSLERFTRIKHDPGSILQVLSHDKKTILNHTFLFCGYHKKYFKNFFFCHLFSFKINKILPYFFFVKDCLSVKKRLFHVFFGQIPPLFLKKPLLTIFLLEERILHIFSPLFSKKIRWHKHHYCHALSGYFLSPFLGERALIFVLDGLGDDQYSSTWIGKHNKVCLISESKTISFGHGIFFSIGYLYSLFTEALGYKIDSDEGKTEALAAYGEPDEKLLDLCKKSHIINKEKLCWEPNINFAKILYNKKFLLSELNRIGRENFSATIQRFLEDTVVEYLGHIYVRYKIDKICLAGGTMANVILNLNIYERTPFKYIYIVPCMGDDGTSFGPAILRALDMNQDISWLSRMIMPYWGPSYSRKEVLEEIQKHLDKIIWEDKNDSWPEEAAKAILDGKIIAVFQGKMEFGPRALGNRSILADPRDPKIREKMNLSIKRRPYFQPFCPSILEVDRKELFISSYSNKHMTMAFRFKEHFRNLFPSACHIDGTARPQFVEEPDNPNYFRLLSEIKRNIGYGIVVNTSFNLHGRAMVMSPDQAMQDFLDCNLDTLFIEGYKITRT